MSEEKNTTEGEALFGPDALNLGEEDTTPPDTSGEGNGDEGPGNGNEGEEWDYKKQVSDLTKAMQERESEFKDVIESQKERIAELKDMVEAVNNLQQSGPAEPEKTAREKLLDEIQSADMDDMDAEDQASMMKKFLTDALSLPPEEKPDKEKGSETVQQLQKELQEIRTEMQQSASKSQKQSMLEELDNEFGAQYRAEADKNVQEALKDADGEVPNNVLKQLYRAEYKSLSLTDSGSGNNNNETGGFNPPTDHRSGDSHSGGGGGDSTGGQPGKFPDQVSMAELESNPKKFDTTG